MLTMVPAAATASLFNDAAVTITTREYELFRQLVLDASGIGLGDAKRELLVARLSRRVRELRLSSFGEYYERVTSDRTGAELVLLLDRVTTNETSFFRERSHFDLLATDIFPRWRAEAAAGDRPRRVRAWSAACSTGQEPYSIAMMMLEHLPPEEGWELEVIGTDLSTRALELAQAATWPIARAEEIPSDMLRRHMLRGTGSQLGRFRATPALRKLVRFQRVNLVDPPYEVTGQFDLVFCRNVMIYFTPAGRAAVVEQLANRLTPNGYLFVGHAESLQTSRDRLRTIVPTVYARSTGA